MNSVGVVIPAYKEKDNLVRLCDAIINNIANSTILIVDDSPDLESLKIIKGQAYNQVNIIHRDMKGGRGSAVILGLSTLIKSKLDYYIEMDADFSHPPEQLNEIINFAKNKNLDLLIASRYMKSSKILNWPLSRRLFSKFSNFVAKLLLQVPVSDYTNGYRLYSHKAAVEIVQSCGQRGAGFIALSEILVCLYYKKFRVGEVSTVFVNRVRGESSLSKTEVFNAVTGLVKIFRYKLRLKK